MTPRLSRRRFGATNYTYLLRWEADAALVDPGEAGAALALAEAEGVAPRWILHTHGHADHSGGSAELAARLGATVVGHSADARWYPPTLDLAGRGQVSLGGLSLRVHHVPGHTPGSVLLEWAGHLLTGDTLFTGGCGNCKHGGDVRALAASVTGVLARLDGRLTVHPGHDYAEANLPFVLALEPGNAAAGARLAEVRAARALGQEPAEVTLEEERRVNPFLRSPDLETFVALRGRRDAW